MKLNKIFIIISVVIGIILAVNIVFFLFEKSTFTASSELVAEVEKNTEGVFQTILAEGDPVVSESNTEINSSTKHKNKPTNPGEEKADEKKKEELIDAFKNSKYPSCDAILEDYTERLNELRKGNSKPFSEFPLSTDPTIKYCQKTNAEFRKKLDSLEKIGKEIVDIKFKEFK